MNFNDYKKAFTLIFKQLRCIHLLESLASSLEAAKTDSLVWYKTSINIHLELSEVLLKFNVPSKAVEVLKPLKEKAKLLFKQLKSSDLRYLYHKIKVVLASAFLMLDDISSAHSELSVFAGENFPMNQLQILLNLQLNRVLAQMFVKYCHFNPGCDVPEFYKCPDEARVYCLRGINQLIQSIFPSLSRHSAYSFSKDVGAVEFGRQSKSVFYEHLFYIVLVPW